MLCPDCSQEMNKGKAMLLGANGLPPLLCTFTDESSKETAHAALNLQNEAYYCPKCKILIPIIRPL